MPALDGADLEIAVDMLGPLRVRVDGRPVAVTTPRLRTLLCVLALSPARPVPLRRLALALWGDRQPDSPRRSLATYITRLRAELGTGSIASQPNTYMLRTAPDRVDVVRFGRLLNEAVATADREQQRRRLVGALSVWRGEPFEDVSSAWLDQVETPQLVERYLGAMERSVDLDISDGHHDEVVARLRQLTARHPLRESLWARLLVALDQGGRTAEALVLYDAVRRRIADELGVDPGPGLRQVYADLHSPARGSRARVPSAVGGQVAP